MHSFTYKIITAAILLVALGCSSTNSGKVTADNKQQLQLQQMMLSNTATIPQYSPRNARAVDEIAPGNKINVGCLDDAGLSGDYAVNFDGSIELPYEVKLNVAGETVSSVATILQKRYATYFKTAPSFKVKISDTKLLVRVDGLVEKPGAFLLDQNGSVDELIGLAGGLRKGTDQQNLARYARIADGSYLAALNLSDHYSGSKSQSLVWRGGETVFLQSDVNSIGDLIGSNKSYVQILGQVRSPGEYQYKESANFFDYLVQAGGPTDRANMANLVVVRPEDGQLNTLPFTLEDPKNIPAIKGGDIVLVQADNPTSLERDTTIFGNIGGFMSALAATVLVAAGL